MSYFEKKFYLHPLSDVNSDKIGEGSTIWQYTVILQGATIGKNCNVNCFCFIENDVVIGDNVTIKSGTYIWDHIRIEDDVFIGPNVVFTNDLRPRSKQPCEFVNTTIQQGASVGANSTILAGVTIGKYAMTGMASVITRNVRPYALVYGNPARQHGWVDEKGRKLKHITGNRWISEDGTEFEETPEGLARVQ